MSISKINSLPFKGYLTIRHNDEIHTFDARKIKSVTNSRKDGGVIIEGQEEPFELSSKILIPYRTISPNTVMSAYKFAKQSENAEIILKG